MDRNPEADVKEDIRNLEDDIERLQDLLPDEVQVGALQNTIIPNLRKQIEEEKSVVAGLELIAAKVNSSQLSFHTGMKSVFGRPMKRTRRLRRTLRPSYSFAPLLQTSHDCTRK